MPGRARDPLLLAFGVTVRRRRIAGGRSQAELAEAAGMHDTYLGGVERGERNLGLLNIGRLAAALGTSLGDLFADVDLELHRPR
jgi:transcriptional regulator with XRE-family HTH domain